MAFDHGPSTGDLEYENAWGVEHIGTREVHQAGNTGQGIKLAVIDTGIDYIHDDPDDLPYVIDPEFLNNYAGGWDFVNNDNDPMDDNGHGTHVAGIARRGEERLPRRRRRTRRRPVRAQGPGGGRHGRLLGPHRGTRLGCDHDMDVVNISLGGHDVSAALQTAVASAYAAGVTIVAASGNVNPVTIQELIYGCPVVYPAAYPESIAVSFTGTDDRLTGCRARVPRSTSRPQATASSRPSPSVPARTAATTRLQVVERHVDGLPTRGRCRRAHPQGRDHERRRPDALADDIKAHLCANTAPGGGFPTTDPRYPNWYGCGIVDADKALLDNPPPGSAQVNDPPVAGDDEGSVAQDGTTTIDVLANDTDPDGDDLTVTTVTDPPTGTASIELDGTVRYTPDPGTSGTDTFDYTVEDPDGLADTATVTMTVSAGNLPPDAVDDTATVAEDGSTSVDVLANDVDPDAGLLTVTAVTDPSLGIAVINGDGSIAYTPDANANGADSFDYTIEDPDGASDTATVHVTVTPGNDPPVAGNDSLSTAEDVAAVIDVLANDDDIDLDDLSVTSVTNPPKGTATIEPDGRVRYQPDANVSGPDAFQYTVSDGAGGTDTATVSVTVTPTNDVPTAAPASASTPFGTAVAIGLAGTDVETCELGFEVVSGPAHGSLGPPANVSCTAGTPNSDSATITYTPAAGWSGPDSFTYRTGDGALFSAPVTVSITVGSPSTSVHVADLDGSATIKGTKWTAKVAIVIHGQGHALVRNAVVTGTWSDGTTGTASCTTNRSGTCDVSKAALQTTTASVRFTITSVVISGSAYLPGSNHDVDAGTNGTTIVVNRP